MFRIIRRGRHRRIMLRGRHGRHGRHGRRGRRAAAIVAALTTTALSASVLATTAGRAAADGTPSPGFGTNGALSLTPATDGGAAVAMPDGRIVVLGHGVIRRLRPDGSADTTFGDGGRVVADNQTATPGGPLRPGADRIAVLDTKRVLVHGPIGSTNVWYALNEDGSRDPNFGFGGYVQSPSLAGVAALLVRSDGDALAWSASPSSGATPVLHAARIDLAPGTATTETTWGDDLHAIVTDGYAVSQVMPTSTGRIIAVVRRTVGGTINGCSIVGISPSGAIDHSFGTNGAVAVVAPSGTTAPECALALMADGSLAVAVSGEFFDTTTMHRYDADGKSTTTTMLAVTGASQQAIGLGDGRLVIAMRSGLPTSTLRLRAFGANDAEDTTFAPGLGTPSGAGIRVSSLSAMPGGGVMMAATVPGSGATATTAAFLVRVDTAAGEAPEPSFAGTNRYVPLTPARILDTRIALGSLERGPVADGGVVDLQVAGAGGVPASGATAVVLNVTAADSTAAGFVTVWPTGAPRPTASNINLERAGQIAPNLVVVKLGGSGRVSMYTKTATQLVADVSGYFESATSSTAGRFVPASAPLRILDTRNTTGGHHAPLARDETITLAVAGVGEIPAAGISAVVVNLTGTSAANAGYVTAWPAGGTRPDVSNLNLDGPGSTRPNLAIVRLGDGGKLSLFSQNGTDLVADVTGWFTDSTQPASSSGLFVPVAPRRLLDTRLGLGALGRDGAARLFVGGSAVVPPQSSSAAVFNLTATDAAAAGFVTAYPAGVLLPTASSLNVERQGETIPNLVAVRTNGRAIDLYSQTGTHLVADLAGYFTS